MNIILTNYNLSTGLHLSEKSDVWYYRNRYLILKYLLCRKYNVHC